MSTLSRVLNIRKAGITKKKRQEIYNEGHAAGVSSEKMSGVVKLTADKTTRSASDASWAKPVTVTCTNVWNVATGTIYINGAAYQTSAINGGTWYNITSIQLMNNATGTYHFTWYRP